MNSSVVCPQPWLSVLFASLFLLRNRVLLDSASRKSSTVGKLLSDMNQSQVQHSGNRKKYLEWRLSGTEEGSWGWPVPESLRWSIRSMQAIAPDYKLSFDLYPSPAGETKWHLALNVDASGDGSQIQQRWSGESDQNPESQAVFAVVLLALRGILGSVKQCEVPDCGYWFLTKADPRVRCCPVHDVDDLRKGTKDRREQLRAAARRAREREKANENSTGNRLRKRRGVTGLVHDASKPTKKKCARRGSRNRRKSQRNHASLGLTICLVSEPSCVDLRPSFDPITLGSGCCLLYFSDFVASCF